MPEAAKISKEDEPRFKRYWDHLKAIVADHPKGRAYDADGQFYPDPTPIAPPVGYVAEPSMFDRVKAMVQRELSERAAEQGMETFEESDDFDVGDYAEEPFSPYEMIMEQFVPDGPVIPDPSLKPMDAPEPPPGGPVKGAEGASEALDGLPPAAAKTKQKAEK